LIPYGSAGGATASFVRRKGKPTSEIDRVHLRLYCKDHDLDKMSNHAIEQLYTLALHEFGHGLGLGHSPSGLDVMYWKSAMKQLSARDRASVLKLYGFQAKTGK
jgi:predicted Zn-dependent protease